MYQTEENQELYFKSQFPKASEYEIGKLRKDWEKKYSAAQGLVADFKKRAGDPAGSTFCDVGFGNGIILTAFADAGAQAYGIEVDQNLLAVASENFKKKNLLADLRLYNGRNFPFPNSFFDLMFSSSVLEHVSYPVDVLKEMHRTLKPGGKIYLAFPNKFTLKETHTGLYFISYMPHWLAERIARVFSRSSLQEWNLHFLSYFWLRKALKKNGIALKVLLEPESPHAIKRGIKKTLALLGIHHSAFLSHVIVILEK